MKKYIIYFLLILSSVALGDYPVTGFDCEVSDTSPENTWTTWNIIRGGSRYLQINYLQNGDVLPLTNAGISTVNLSLKASDSTNVYLLAGSVHSATGGSVRVLWSSTNAVPAALYNAEFLVPDVLEINMAARGKIKVAAGNSTGWTNETPYFFPDPVTRIIAGDNITISPTGGKGDVTINAEGGSDTNTLAETLAAGNDANGLTMTNVLGITIGDAAYSTMYPLKIDQTYEGIIRGHIHNPNTTAQAVNGAVWEVKANTAAYGSFGMTGTNSTVHGGVHGNKLHIFNYGLGNTMFATDGGFGYTWGADPAGGHTYASLTNTVMSLDKDGNLTVGGSVLVNEDLVYGSGGLLFGDGGTGFREASDTSFDIRVNNSTMFTLNQAGGHLSIPVNGAALMPRAAGTLVLPTYAIRGDTDTGVTSTNANTLSLVAGGSEEVLIKSGSVAIAGNLGVSSNVTVAGVASFSGSAVLNLGSLQLKNNVELYYGTGKDYYERYNSSGTAYELWTSDGDGGGTDTKIMSVQDGTDDVDFAGDLTVAGNLGVSSNVTVAGDVSVLDGTGTVTTIVAPLRVVSADGYTAEFLGEDSAFAGFMSSCRESSCKVYQQLYNIANDDAWTMMINGSTDMWQLRDGNASSGTVAIEVNDSEDVSIPNGDLTVDGDATFASGKIDMTTSVGDGKLDILNNSSVVKTRFLADQTGFTLDPFIFGSTVAVTGNVTVAGEIALPITTPDLTGNTYTIIAGQHTVLIDDDDPQVTGTVTVQLPAATANAGRILNIKKIGSSESVSVDGFISETIDGSTTQQITTQYSNMTIQCDGTSWWIL